MAPPPQSFEYQFTKLLGIAKTLIVPVKPIITYIGIFPRTDVELHITMVRAKWNQGWDSLDSLKEWLRGKDSELVLKTPKGKSLTLDVGAAFREAEKRAKEGSPKNISGKDAPPDELLPSIVLYHLVGCWMECKLDPGSIIVLQEWWGDLSDALGKTDEPEAPDMDGLLGGLLGSFGKNLPPQAKQMLGNLGGAMNDPEKMKGLFNQLQQVSGPVKKIAGQILPDVITGLTNGSNEEGTAAFSRVLETVKHSDDMKDLSKALQPAFDAAVPLAKHAGIDVGVTDLEGLIQKADEEREKYLATLNPNAGGPSS
jgi:hypothetical protein